MLKITPNIFISLSEIKITFIASSGPGGQNVNKVATAVHLRFNVRTSDSLSETLREYLMIKLANKLTNDGELIIKANRFRTQEKNKEDALARLCEIIKTASYIPIKRKKTRPTLSTKKRRLDAKKLQGEKKTLRRRNVE